MLMSDRLFATAAVLVWAALAGQAQAADARPLAEPLTVGASPALSAFADGRRAFADGRTDDALKAFETAAQGGHYGARWKLGRMYRRGEGVVRDHVKAFEYFRTLANDVPEIDIRSPGARFVANAYVALGLYYADGIDNYLEPHIPTAENYLFHAASYFGDADAQYHLGRFYLDERYGSPRNRSGIRWLKLAAEKGHVGAQGLLGVSLIEQGRGGQSRQRGLAWITIARKSAQSDDYSWIRDKHEEYFAAATEDQRRDAYAAAELWQQGAGFH